MKKKILSIITCAALALSLTGCGTPEDDEDDEDRTSSVSDKGDDSEDDDSDATSAEFFEYSKENGEITITKYTGTDENVIIPSKINNTPVTKIGDSAFSGCESLTSVKIPDSVTSISITAFFECKCIIKYKGQKYSSEEYDAWYNAINGASSDNPESNPGDYDDSIATSADQFEYKEENGKITITKYNGADKNVTIPHKIEGKPVSKIGEEAFKGCKINTITLPDSVTKIDKETFSGCKINTITLPDSVTEIAKGAFIGCTINTITIPDSVTKIDKEAFVECICKIKYKGKTYSSEEYEVWYNAISGTSPSTPPTNPTSPSSKPSSSSSTKPTTPSSKPAEYAVITGGEQFEYEEGDGKITITKYNGFDKKVTIPHKIDGKPVTKIGKSSFYNRPLTNVTIPDSVTKINGYAFSSCTSLTSISIPNSVTEIGDGVFIGCTSLTSITIPNSVTDIGIRTFQDCTSLTNVSIPNSVTSIGEKTFNNCTSLKSITIPNSVTDIGYDAFSSCTSLKSITIPNSVKEIGHGAFWCCTSLTNVSIPNSVTEISDNAFSRCTSLTSITIPNSVTKISNSAFFGCKSLKNITIPNSVTEICQNAFSECPSLANITIPDSVTKIAPDVFKKCKCYITYKGRTYSPEEYGALYNAVNYIPPSTPSNIPGVYDDSIATSADLFEYEENKDGTIKITGYTGSGEKVIIPHKINGKPVKWIGQFAFINCTELTSVTLPDSVTHISRGAFSNCTSLTSITIPNSVTIMDDYVFADCTSLTSVTIPDNVTISYFTFLNCECDVTYKGKTYPPKLNQSLFYATKGM